MLNLWHVQILIHDDVLNLRLVASHEDQIFDYLEEKFAGYRLRSIGVHAEDVIVLRADRGAHHV
jgi:hypothetical protein